MKKFLKFYHSRLLAELRFFLPMIFLMILALEIFLPRTDFEKNKLAGKHQALAQQLIASNQFAQAKKELLPGDPLLITIENLELQPEKVKDEIIFWQRVTEKFPNYRDGYLKLAILNWKIYRLFDAKKFLEKALEIDPNNEISKKLIYLGNGN